MKKIFLPLVLAAIFLFSSFSQAADKVVVVPLGGTNVYVDPRNIISFYHQWDDALQAPAVISKVPADKHFVLTDIIGYGRFVISENDIPKIQTYVETLGTTPHSNPINISSGIVFGPETEIRVNPRSNYSFITISGYYY